MTTTSFLLPIEFDLAATFLMAMTGVWAASRRGYDVIGAFTLAFVSGVGGGLLRGGSWLVSLILVKELYMVFAAVLIGFTSYELASALRFAGRIAQQPAVVDRLLGRLRRRQSGILEPRAQRIGGRTQRCGHAARVEHQRARMRSIISAPNAM